MTIGSQPEPMQSDLLNIAEAARFLRLKQSTLRAWVLHRQIQFVKLGGKRVFFKRTDLEKLIENSIVPAKPCEAFEQKKAA